MKCIVTVAVGFRFTWGVVREPGEINVSAKAVLAGGIRRQGRSGLMVVAFCQREGVSMAVFYAWRKRLREQAGSERRPRRQAGLNSDGFFSMNRPNFTFLDMANCHLAIVELPKIARVQQILENVESPAPL
jgi:transposase-like protein